MGGTVIGGLTAPRLADAWGLAAPFRLAAALVATVGAMFLVLARDAPRPAGPSGPAPSLFAPFAISARAGVPGRSPLLLPRLRRLRCDVPLPA